METYIHKVSVETRNVHNEIIRIWNNFDRYNPNSTR